MAIFAAVTAGAALAANDAIDIERAAGAFYKSYLDARPAGVPAAPVRAKLARRVSPALERLLRHADAAEKRYAAVTKNKVPPLAEGDLFTSLFEGASAFAVKSCTPADAKASCLIELSRADAGGKPATQWTDRIYLVRAGGRWLVDDIEFLGNWQFMHKGRLTALLEQVIHDGANARP